MNSYYHLSLTPRDQAVEKTVRYLRQVTSSQLRRIHFSTGTERTQKVVQARRCKRLVEMGVISRLPRLVGGLGGSADYIYVPVESRSRQVNMHTLELSELYTRLIEAERAGRLEKLDYQSEPLCWHKIGNIQVMPDARAKFSANGYKFDLWIELDRSTEYRTKLSEKMRRFVKLYNVWEDALYPRVVFIVPEAERLTFVKDIAKRQEMPQLFDVVLFSEAIDKLIGG